MRSLDSLPAEVALDVLPNEKPEQSLAKLIRERTSQGQSLVKYWLGVLADPKAKTADKLRASELLAQRGWGKPKEIIEVQGEINHLSDIPTATLQHLIALIESGKIIEGEFKELDGDTGTA